MIAPVVRSLYEDDFVQWCDRTAQQLRSHHFDQLDLEHLIEEVVDLGNRHRDALYSNLKVVLLHLLKWQYQPERRSNSWRASLREHRQRIRRQLQQHPSLKPYLVQCLDECYDDARALAADETGLPLYRLPQTSPYAISQIQDENWLPAACPPT